MTFTIFWIAVALTIVAAALVSALLGVADDPDELGSVSVNWLAEHRVE